GLQRNCSAVYARRVTSLQPNPLLPQPFIFGVATAGFQIEGGYNGPNEPTNNWAPWEAAGRVEPSGWAVGFWEDYEEHLDRAASIGLDAFRLSIEWARCLPQEGIVDDEAVLRYRSILSAIHARGMTPLVTLHHFTHPGWLPVEFWTDPESPTTFLVWVEFAIATFGDLCNQWITSNELNIYSVNSFLTGIFPPGWRGKFQATMASIDHLLTAHVLAYAAIHAIQPDAIVATNNYSLSIYELDRMPLDLLMARRQGIAEPDLGRWLEMRRRRHYDLVPKGPGPIYPYLEEGLRQLTSSKVDLATALPRARAAIYASEYDCTLDVAQLDYYAPVAAEHLVLPGTPTTGGRNTLPARSLWDDRPDPAMFTTYCIEARDLGMPVWVVENGMCNRVVNGRSFARADGWDRPRYLRENFGALIDAVAQGVDVRAYFHWTLVDNYEWGSYEPRFGLFGCDRPRGNKISALDAMGRDSAGAYRAIIEAIRTGDASALGR
ncbi:MAG: family 1 glycosylhydrolase, partial [Actinomycetota bacterium]